MNLGLVGAHGNTCHIAWRETPAGLVCRVKAHEGLGIQMSGQSTPPGWFDQADGSKRYWDGTQWTNQVQPGGPVPGPGMIPPPAAKKRGIPAWGWVLIIIGAFVLICGGGGLIMAGLGGKAAVDAVESAQASASAAASSGIEQGLGSQDASGDVVLGTPTTDQFIGLVTLPMTITNSSDKRSTYFIELSAESPDGATQLDTTFASAQNVEPGQAAQTDAMFTKTLPAGTVFVVKSVQRTSDVG